MFSGGHNLPSISKQRQRPRQYTRGCHLPGAGLGAPRVTEATRYWARSTAAATSLGGPALQQISSFGVKQHLPRRHDLPRRRENAYSTLDRSGNPLACGLCGKTGARTKPVCNHQGGCQGAIYVVPSS